MGLLGLVDTKEVEAFANTLAEDLGRRFPPASEQRTDAGAPSERATSITFASALAPKSGGSRVRVHSSYSDSIVEWMTVTTYDSDTAGGASVPHVMRRRENGEPK